MSSDIDHKKALPDECCRLQDDGAWVLGKAPDIRKIARHVQRAAEVECTVLISGETGTGKELWAQCLHQSSARKSAPMIPVNCAALTSTLAESQLFGHEKGSFTGAIGSALGVFRAAEGGIVFLDEIGEMPLELQPKLLRVLQEAEVTPVGSSTAVRINVQVIAATNRNLEVEVAEGRFREDLFYRLNMVELKIPSLRNRMVDIPEFINFFSRKFAEKYQRELWQPDSETLRSFCEYHWPGNIRQLSHVIEQSYVLDCAATLPTQSIRLEKNSLLPCFDLDRLRSLAINQALNSTNGHKGKAARLLGIHANTLTRLLAQLPSESTEASGSENQSNDQLDSVKT